MPWWREPMAALIVFVFGFAGAMAFGGIGLAVGFVLGIVVAAASGVAG